MTDLCSCGEPVLPGYDNCRSCEGFQVRFVYTTARFSYGSRQARAGIFDREEHRFGTTQFLPHQKIMDILEALNSGQSTVWLSWVSGHFEVTDNDTIYR